MYDIPFVVYNLQVLQHVTRIAEALLALQQAGNVKYSGWMMNFNCATYIADQGPKQEPQLEVESAKQRVIELKNIAKHMETELEAWVNDLAVSRSNYYKLNYYTTLQVLRLRKELAQRRGSISAEVLALLQCISNDVTSQKVQGIVMEVIEERLKQQNEVEVQDPQVVVLECKEPSIAKNQERLNSEAVESETVNVLETPPLPQTEQRPEPTKENDKTLPPPDSETQEHITTSGLVENNLNERQKEILEDLTGYSGYSRTLVLKAFEECPDADQYDIANWCDEHEEEIVTESEDKEDTTSQEETKESTSYSQASSSEADAVEAKDAGI